MSFRLLFTREAEAQLSNLALAPANKVPHRAVLKALALLQIDPRYPGLHTHKNSSWTGPNGQDVFQSYAQNRTPGAYRIFWFYGPGSDVITIIAIIPHPD